jgi:hypothetical protein
MKRTVVLTITSLCSLMLLFAIGCGNTDNMLSPTDDSISNSVEAADGTHQLIPTDSAVKGVAKDANLQKNDGGNPVEAADGNQQAVPAGPPPCPTCVPPEFPA